MSDDREQAFWDDYWAHGPLHSCTNAFSGNYAGEIRALWEAFFATATAKDRVVDIGTGNGAVAAIANEVSRSRGLALDIHGVDLAAIDPLNTVVEGREALQGIGFHPRTSASDMPFETASVHAVSGQYALEYTPVEASLGEIARVLVPGGRARFVIHHRDSVILATAAEELAHAAAVFDETQLIDRLEAVLRRIDAAASPAARQALATDPEAEAERTAFNQAAAAIGQRIAQAQAPEMLQATLGMLGEAYQGYGSAGLAATLVILARVGADLRANVERLEDLRAAAVDAAGFDGIAATAEAVGLEVRSRDLVRHEGQRLMGWRLDLVRADRP